jgi:DNA-binding XRE family transcriptional regulator
MKTSEPIPLRDVIESHRADPEFRKLWDESAVAREVAVAIVRYRAEHHLTQGQLAKLVGTTQPAISRLEIGEVTPTLKTLARVTAATGLRFNLEVAHGGVELLAA